MHPERTWRAELAARVLQINSEADCHAVLSAIQAILADDDHHVQWRPDEDPANVGGRVANDFLCLPEELRGLAENEAELSVYEYLDIKVRASFSWFFGS